VLQEENEGLHLPETKLILSLHMGEDGKTIVLCARHHVADGLGTESDPRSPLVPLARRSPVSSATATHPKVFEEGDASESELTMPSEASKCIAARPITEGGRSLRNRIAVKRGPDGRRQPHTNPHGRQACIYVHPYLGFCSAPTRYPEASGNLEYTAAYTRQRRLIRQVRCANSSLPEKGSPGAQEDDARFDIGRVGRYANRGAVATMGGMEVAAGVGCARMASDSQEYGISSWSFLVSHFRSESPALPPCRISQSLGECRGGAWRW
jgi:hypothetical protein